MGLSDDGQRQQISVMVSLATFPDSFSCLVYVLFYVVMQMGHVRRLWSLLDQQTRPC